MTDNELLQAFAHRQDQGAFRQLVERYADLVYSAAVRQVPNHAMAEDVTQAVFIVLARRANRVNGATLTGWLIKCARLTALDAYRGERRRRAHEQKAAAMQSEIRAREPAEWNRLSPMVDDFLVPRR